MREVPSDVDWTPLFYPSIMYSFPEAGTQSRHVNKFAADDQVLREDYGCCSVVAARACAYNTQQSSSVSLILNEAAFIVLYFVINCLLFVVLE